MGNLDQAAEKTEFMVLNGGGLNFRVEGFGFQIED